METRVLRVHLARASRTICAILRLAIGCGLLHAAIASAQEPAKTATVAILANASSMDEPVLSDFRRTLRDRGYVEGSNLRIEFRTTRGDATQLARLANELVQIKPDAIFVTWTSGAIALKQVSSSIPVVMVGNPAGTELTASLARPTANVTGFSIVSRDLTRKRLQLLKEAMPRLTRVAVVWDPESPWHPQVLQDIKAAGRELSVMPRFYPMRSVGDFQPVIAAARRENAQALYILETPLVFVRRAELMAAATAAHLPVMHAVKELAVSGALLTYGPIYGDLYKRSAEYVVRILKGARPQDLPIEQPTTFELVLNLKTARQLGIQIPDGMRLRADEVIE